MVEGKTSAQAAIAKNPMLVEQKTSNISNAD